MNALFEALCRASAFGLAALAVALLAQWLLGGRVPASWRAWIWRIALLQSVFALLPLAPIRWEILAPPIAATPTVIVGNTKEFPVVEDLNSTPSLEIPDAPPLESSIPLESAPPIPIAKAPPGPFDWRALVLAIYALGIVFQFAQLARGKRQMQRTLRACTPIGNAVLTAHLSTLTARLNLRSAPQLLISEGISPFLTGVWRPKIVLPRALCEAKSSQLDAILAHELAHAKRRDLLWLGATWLLQTLLWFHPLSWAARRFHGLETECACDELALQLAPIAPQSYGALLLNSMNNSKFSSPLAAGTCDTLFALKTRLLRLNNAPKKPRKLAKFAFVTALLLSCGALVPLKLVARAGDAPPNLLAEAQSSPSGLITEPQYDARAVVQGIVISKATQKPLANVPIILIAPYRLKEKKIDLSHPFVMRYQAAKTDARGYYRFNTIGGGKHSLGIAGLTTDWGFSAELLYDFNLKNGHMREFKTAIDEDFARPGRALGMTLIHDIKDRGSAVVQGVVKSNRTQKPLAGVPIVLAYGKSSWRSVTDARGYFHFNARAGRYSLAANNDTPSETFPLANGQKRDFNFQLNELRAPSVADVAVTPPASENTGTASGQIVDENKQPLAGATVTLYDVSGGMGRVVNTKESDANGRFRFEGLRPDSKISLSAWLKGYGAMSYRISKRGKTTIFSMTMPRASATLRGVVIEEDGQPTQNFRVEPFGFSPSARTDAQGRFLLRQIEPGATGVRVYTPNGSNGWGPFDVRGGDQNVKIRLTKSTSYARFPRIGAKPATPKP